MPLLHTVNLIGRKKENRNLTKGEVFSILYHDIFDYPLCDLELIKWQTDMNLSDGNLPAEIIYREGHFLVKGRETLILKKMIRKRVSTRKFKLARKIGKIIGMVPGVKMVAITGALAMDNATEDSDIDFMVVTRANGLWTTRALVLKTLDFLRISRRKFGDKDQKDKTCLNIWLDENSLAWPKNDRNVYTAHEIAQIVPIVNKESTYQRFITKNSWIRKYWPKVVTKVQKLENKSIKPKTNLFDILEIIAYRLQYLYMRKKITREVVTPTRALFHPVDWGTIVLNKLQKRALLDLN